MYAIIETGGKQLKVEVGQEIFVEKLEINPDEIYTFEKVLAINDASLKLGNPYLKGVNVKAKAIKQGKGKKIVIYKYKQKNGSSHRKQGHRQPYTKLIIESIAMDATKPKIASETEKPASKETKAKATTKTVKEVEKVAKPKKDDKSKDV